MTYTRFITTPILLMLLNTAIPAFAQKDDERKGGGNSPQRQHGAQPRNTRESQRQAQPQLEQRGRRQAQSQRSQERVPERSREAQPQRQQQAERRDQSRRERQPDAYNRGGYRNRDDNANHGNGNYGRISSSNYSSHFGRDHRFRMGRPEMIDGYNRFQYGGYWFGYNQRWPDGWNYDDDCYVVYEDGAYYMYNERHPGIHISLNIF